MPAIPRSVPILLSLAISVVGSLGAQPPKPTTPDAAVRTVPLARVLRVGPPTLRIGSEDEEGPYMFGGSISVAQGPDGIIYASEYPDGTIKAFAPDGRHLLTFGRRGRGPGEFVNLQRLYHDGDSTLYASQPHFGTTVLTAKGGRIAYRTMFNVGVGSRTHCFMGDSLVESGWNQGRMLHVMGNDHAIVRSFGEGWSQDTIERVREMENGMASVVTCDPHSDRIYLTNLLGPRLRAYQRDGTLLWETELPGFRHASFKAQGDKGAAYFFGDDHIEEPIPLAGDRLIVPVYRVDYQRAPRRRSPTAGASPPVVARSLYVLDSRTGRIQSRSTMNENEPLGRVVDDTTAIQILMDPFPQLVRRRITFVTGRN